ncbi:1707_t:CDS:2 [Ambispora leptoticha]|uniref:1707_t:CDS:1 n=1 Tax=Ambispora leptoticha TaxID=144679 RepID=A0A9N9B3Z5_9GLOM|nr:1707_t:CDS:2 [Ambispora leptoticha]
MSHSQVYSLWIFLEGHPEPSLLDDITFSLRREANLSDLAPYLISRINELAKVGAFNPRLFNYDNRIDMLPAGTTLKVVEQDTSAAKPLVVRYQLSDNTSRGQAQIPRYSRENSPSPLASEDENEFYFVDQETKKKTIDTEFTFNGLVKKTKPNCENVNLLVRIKGKKAYGDWGIKEMLPLGLNLCLTDRRFTDNLAKLASAFHDKGTTNEATARNYINPLMVEAVAKVRLKHPQTMLAVEEDLYGSRGYGRLDYVVYCQDLAVLITQAKMVEMQKEITQNIVQLHTAAEVPNIVDFVLIAHSGLFIATFQKRKRKLHESITSPPIICGIVSTGIAWRFLRWSGTPEDPTVKISKIVLTPQTDVEAGRIDEDKKKGEERLAQRVRLE